MQRRVILACAALLGPLAVLACEQIAGVRDLSLAPAGDGAAADGASDVTVPPTDGSNADAGDGAAESGSWPVVSLASSPTRIVLDDTYLYWTTLPGFAGGGELLRMPKAGGPAEVLADKLAAANALGIDHGALYLASGQNFDDGRIDRVPLDGGVPAPIATGMGSVLGVAADDTSVVWVDLGDGGNTAVTGRVARAGVDGGAPTDLVTELVVPNGIALDGTAVYFTTRGLGDCDGGALRTGTVERLLPDGGGHVTLASGLDCPGPVVVHDTRIFWVNLVTGAGTVNVMQKDGGGMAVLADKQALPSGVATDGVNVYWVNATVPDGTVLGCAIADCAATVVPIGTSELGPVAIAADETHLFWADVGVPPKQTGSLHRVPLGLKP